MEKEKRSEDTCYKHLFNTLNYQSAHFPPPEYPNEKKFFPYFVDLFKYLLNVEYADFLFKEALDKEVYDAFHIIINSTGPSSDIMIMVLSSITPKERKKLVFNNKDDRNYARETINNSWELFTSRYTHSEYGGLTKQQFLFLIVKVLNKGLHLVSVLEKNKTNEYDTVCICNPVLFGMGDEEWEKFIVKVLCLLQANEDDPLQIEKIEYASKIINLAEQYLFSNVQTAKLHKAWQPPLYRVIPAQLDSSSNCSRYKGLIKTESSTVDGEMLRAEGFEEWIKPMLWEWDKISDIFHDNDIRFARAEKCGCMGEHAILDNASYGKRASIFLDMNDPELSIDDSRQLFSFCISFRQESGSENNKETGWLPVFKHETNELADVLKQKLGDAEDFKLLHTVFNFKKSDSDSVQDFLTFLCNCHRNWCLQLRPQNECRNRIVNGKKAQINGVQKAFYNVSLTGNCGECRDCFCKENTNDNTVEFVCPVYAFSDRKRCIGCLACVRHCYMKHGKISDVETKSDLLEVKTRGLKVTRVLDEKDLPIKVPETRWDCDKARLESATENIPQGINWQQFQYEV